MHKPQEPQWLTAARLAEMLGVSTMTIWRWSHEKKYGCLKFPRPAVISDRRYWNRDEINAWMRDRVVDSARRRKTENAA